MEVIPAAQEYGLGVIPWSPLHGGLLGGAIRKEREGGGAGGRSGDGLADTAIRAQIQAYEDLLDKHGIEPGEAALAWLLTRPGVTGPIVGPRTVEQLDSALRAVELELSDEVLASLDEIFPGPGPSPGGLRLVVPSGRSAAPRPSDRGARLPVAPPGTRTTGTATAEDHARRRDDGQLVRAATTRITNISTSTPAMIRFRVFGSTVRA